MYDSPLAFFLTFTTHGTWFHGDPRASIIREHQNPHRLPAHAGMLAHHEKQLKTAPFIMDSCQRNIVKDIIVRHCDIRKWRLFALHVRSNHVHVVLKADQKIDRVAVELKSWATRMLRSKYKAVFDVWARGSSRKYIFKESKLREKIRYVIYEQGEMMSYHIDEAFK